MMNKRNCYIFTGGPGSGKSSVIGSLAEKGHATVEEVGRKIIKEQLAMGGDALPWQDKIKYRDLMLKHAINDYLPIQETNELVFFDRGIPDLIAYTRLIGEAIPDELIKAAQEYRYNKKIFIFPAWKEIYSNDEERKQTYGEAVETYEAMQIAYSENHYELIEVPKTSIDDRVKFILEAIA